MVKLTKPELAANKRERVSLFAKKWSSQILEFRHTDD